MGFVMVAGGARATAPVNYKANFADNTWAQIIDACQKNKVPETWVVGSQKTMTINGVDYPIDIIGKNHDTYSDGSGTATLTFQMHDCYADAKQMNSSNTNSGGWTDCAMRTTYLPAILALMPSEVQAGIKEVNKLTADDSKSSTINIAVDKLFLLSEIEVFGLAGYSRAGEGTQYDYYKTNGNQIKNLSGSSANWWERSPRAAVTNQFCYVTIPGNNLYLGASNELGVSFAFCF